MDLITFTQAHIQSFFLIFVRITGIFIVAPVFGSRNIPVLQKAALSFLLALVLLPLLSPRVEKLPEELSLYFLLTIKELAVGLLIGLLCLLIFVGVQYAGVLVDTQIGFRIANVVDPQTGQEVSIVGQVAYLLAILIFLFFNGHHIIIAGLVRSFEVIPLDSVNFTGELVAHLDRTIADIFLIGLKIAAPTIALLFICEVAMGFIARTVPAINIFFVGLPLRIGLGLFMFGLCLPFFVYVFKMLIIEMQQDLMILLKVL